MKVKYSKYELLSICKLFIDYETKMKFASDKYYVLISLLYDITNKASDDINERLSKIEQMIQNGNFKTSNVDESRIDRIKMALNGKQDRARELKQENKISEQKTQPDVKEENSDEFLSDFLKMSGATLGE